MHTYLRLFYRGIYEENNKIREQKIDTIMATIEKKKRVWSGKVCVEQTTYGEKTKTKEYWSVN